MTLKRGLMILPLLVFLAGCFQPVNDDQFNTVSSQLIAAQETPGSPGGDGPVSTLIDPDNPDLQPTDPGTIQQDDLTQIAQVVSPTATNQVIEGETEVEVINATSPPPPTVAGSVSGTVPTATDISQILTPDAPRQLPTDEPPTTTPTQDAPLVTPTELPDATDFVPDDADGETTEPDPESVDAQTAPEVDADCVYIIEPGDNLFRIAIINDISLDALLAENDLTRNSIIQIGQVIELPIDGCEDGRLVDTSGLPTQTPQPTATPTEIGTETYIVQPGDVLSTIAARFGTNVNTLVQLNDLANPNSLRVGQRLLIPVQD